MSPAADTPLSSVTLDTASPPSSRVYKLAAPLTKPTRTMSGTHTPSPSTIRSSPRSPKRPRSHSRGSGSVNSVSPPSLRRAALLTATAERASSVDLSTPPSGVDAPRTLSFTTPSNVPTPGSSAQTSTTIARSLLSEFDAVDECTIHREASVSSITSDEFFADNRRRHYDGFRLRWNWDPVRDCALNGCWRWEPLSAGVGNSAATV